MDTTDEIFTGYFQDAPDWPRPKMTDEDVADIRQRVEEALQDAYNSGLVDGQSQAMREAVSALGELIGLPARVTALERREESRRENERGYDQ
jgi:hypothetical protein